MDEHLSIALNLLLPSSKVIFATRGTLSPPSRYGEVVIEKYKLEGCPDIPGFMSAIKKKINRSEIFRSQKYTTSICILLLASRGFTITSSVMIGVADTFIERCWECLQVISYNVPKSLQEWLILTIGDRQPSEYSALFCQFKSVSSLVSFVGKSIPISNAFVRLDTRSMGIPDTMWHKDDCISETMKIHLAHSRR